jgi:DNA-binding NtrC family response regulator
MMRGWGTHPVAGAMGNLPLPAGTAGCLHVLVVEEDAAIRGACCEIANSYGFAAHGLGSLEAARGLIESDGIDIVLLDQRAAMGPGFDLLERLRTFHPETAIVVMTAVSSVSSAVEAMRSGAHDYLIKPFALEELAHVLQRLAQHRTVDEASRGLREKLRAQLGFANIVGQSPEMEKLYRILSKVAQTTHPVLILGESGTGKEVVARAIHAHGLYAHKPFLPVDCSSIVPTLMESELFGHVKGAFTGATRTRDGLLAAAEGGTVFLDEIGELAPDLQAKLLRALQEKEVRPVGATHRVKINARILAATNRNLAEMVEQGKFRRDLYYRLNVVKLLLPPLRDRREDIPLLAAHFLDRIGRDYGKSFRLSAEALSMICEYPWPGNVRELSNAMERACSFCSGEVVQAGDLTSPVKDFHLQAALAGKQRARERRTPTAEAEILSLAAIEKRAILETLQQVHGDKLLAAKLLAIGKTTLYRKLKEYGMGDEGGMA